MNNPNLQPERTTAPEKPRPVIGEILEIRNVTLKEALQVVRSLAERDRSRD